MSLHPFCQLSDSFRGLRALFLLGFNPAIARKVQVAKSGLTVVTSRQDVMRASTSSGTPDTRPCFTFEAIRFTIN